MTLRLFPEVLDTVDMVSGFNKLLRVIDAVMSELRDIQSIITQKAIITDNDVRFDRSSNDRNQSILLGIRDDDDVHFAASIEQSEYRNFSRRAASALPLSGSHQTSFRRLQSLLKATALFRRASVQLTRATYGN
jgi:hypothetical protein